MLILLKYHFNEIARCYNGIITKEDDVVTKTMRLEKS